MKRWLFRLLGKDPEAVVVTFYTGPQELCERMYSEIRGLVPERRHYIVTVTPGVTAAGAKVIELQPGDSWRLYAQLRRAFAHLRIGLAPVIFAGGPHPLRNAACWFAPRRILAYNSRLERHHLRITSPIASYLFWRGVPLDRIFLRPHPWNPHRIETPGVIEHTGRPPSTSRRRLAVLSPYVPYPLAHGGAVRIYNLLKEAAQNYDISLYAFYEDNPPKDLGDLPDFCAGIHLVKKPRYREPRWSTLVPPEVAEYRSSEMRKALDRAAADIVQVEYTQLAPYGGDILVEHDVTFDLYRQIHARTASLSAWWDYYRWRRFERRAVRQFRRVVVMSDKDRTMLPGARTVVIENGVDLDRFRPNSEQPGRRVLFIGSFRHFPNINAYRFFSEDVWPLLDNDVELTVVAGPDYLTYWRAFTDRADPAPNARVRLLGFVADVRPLYEECNLVVVPTTVSAGTNVKVLEAMAMQRAVVSTSSGCAGLGLTDRESVLVADTAHEFAKAVSDILSDPAERARLAANARRIAEDKFGWDRIGQQMRDLLDELR